MTLQQQAREPGWQSFDEIQREMDRFLHHFARGKRPRVVFSDQVWQPNVDVYEAQGRAVVLVDLAGVDRDAIQIEARHDELTLRGERQPPRRSGECIVHELEVPWGAFERRVQLPYPVDASRAEASYEDGFLRIVLPRLEPEQPRRVQVRASEADQV